MPEEEATGGGYGAVLVLVDDEPSSQLAAEVAAELAERSDGKLHVVTVPDSEAGGAREEGDGDGIPDTGSPGRDPDEAEAHRLEAAAGSVRSRWDCPVETAVVDRDHPPGGLEAYQSMTGVGLTVLAEAHDITGGDADPLGATGVAARIRSVLEDRLPTPVLLLPTRVRRSNGPDGYSLSDPDPVAVLLGPSDTNADASLPAHAARFAAVSGAELWLVDASPSGSLLELDTVDPGRPQPEEQQIEKRERLREMSRVLESRGLTVRHEIVAVGEQAPRDALNRFLREHVVGTVAVGPEGWGLARQLGSAGVPHAGAEDAEKTAASVEARPVAMLLCPAAPPEDRPGT